MQMHQETVQSFRHFLLHQELLVLAGFGLASLQLRGP